MRVSLGTFACSCIEARFGGSLVATVDAALGDFADRCETGSGSPPVPRFWLEQGPTGKTIDFDISVDRRVRPILEREALRQGLPIERLLTHAVFVYLANPPAVDCTDRRHACRLPRRKNPCLREVT
jgi:hypothetical protein